MFKLVDAFHTIQGEGELAGSRALFIRLPFCNLKCSWCDTEFNTYKEYSEESLVELINQEKHRFAVITGGEPMMNKQTPDVVSFLKRHEFKIACETNGTFPIVNWIDFVTVSPKREANYEIDIQARLLANEFKYVVDDGFDFNVLKQHDNFPKIGKRFSLSPEFNNMKASLDLIIEYIKENPEWKISLQTHKWMQIP